MEPWVSGFRVLEVRVSGFGAEGGSNMAPNGPCAGIRGTKGPQTPLGMLLKSWIQQPFINFLTPLALLAPLHAEFLLQSFDLLAEGLVDVADCLLGCAEFHCRPSTASRALGRCCRSAKAKAVPKKPLPSARLVLLRSWSDPRQQPSPTEPATCKARLHPKDSGS